MSRITMPKNPTAKDKPWQRPQTSAAIVEAVAAEKAKPAPAPAAPKPAEQAKP